MKKLCLLLITCVLAGSVFAADVIVPSNMSCRTEGLGNADINRHDSQKLSVRASSNGNKSWIKYDQLGAYDLSTLRGAVLTVALHNPKTGSQTCDLSAVNDDVTDNILWVDHPINEDPGNGIYALTWNNAPGNLTSDLGLLDPLKTAYLDTIAFTDGLPGDSFDIDVLAVLQADTDGTVQFVLHNSPNLLDFATSDHPTEAWRSYLTLTFPPEGADWPNPEVGEVVETSQASLSWTNPDPNDGVSDITCTVYLGTEPNRIGNMESVSLGAGVSSVAINTTNFPTYGSLANDTMYYWYVDCQDPSRSPASIPGEEWSFYVGLYPSADAGLPQVVWLDTDPNVTVYLDGTASDDGAYTVLWTQTGGPDGVTVTISPDDAEDTSVNLTRGEYEFTLTANDGYLETSDTVRIVVGDDACDASHLDTGAAYNAADENQDCIVDLDDLVALIINDWLECTDTLTNCGQE